MRTAIFTTGICGALLYLIGGYSGRYVLAGFGLVYFVAAVWAWRWA